MYDVCVNYCCFFLFMLYLIAELDDLSNEFAYSVIIEKLYNLCYMAKIDEAYALSLNMIEICLINNSLNIKAWYERFLTVVHFFSGRMKECILYYENSFNISEEENRSIEIHNVGIYAAKAYQMLGEREHSLRLLDIEIKKMKNRGQFEELWAGYMFAADISFHNENLDQNNFENSIKYCQLANEYAILYRKTAFQKQTTNLLYFTIDMRNNTELTDFALTEMHNDFAYTNDYFKSLFLARKGHYISDKADYEQAEILLNNSIEIGEKANLMLGPTISYGDLANISLIKTDFISAAKYIKRYFQLCSKNGIFSGFQALYQNPLIKFAIDNEIEPEITKEIIKFSNYKTKKVFIETLGGFVAFPYDSRTLAFKMSSKKERELFAFLLSAGPHGATKDQIYNAIWFDSNSEDIKSVIAVNLSSLKNDLRKMGIVNSIINNEKHYSICMDEIELDIKLVENSYIQFKKTKDLSLANEVLALYRGEYLSNFEALWAIPLKLKYQQIYDEVLETIGNGSKET